MRRHAIVATLAAMLLVAVTATAQDDDFDRFLDTVIAAYGGVSDNLVAGTLGPVAETLRDDLLGITPAPCFEDAYASMWRMYGILELLQVTDDADVVAFLVERLGETRMDAATLAYSCP